MEKKFKMFDVIIEQITRLHNVARISISIVEFFQYLWELREQRKKW